MSPQTNVIKKKERNQNLTIPNAMSLFRILVIPFFVVFAVRDNIPGALIALGLSGLSDALDGFVARRFNQITELGKMLDPLADKITQFTLTLCLSLKYPVLRNVLALFVVKEVFQLTLGIINLRKGKMLPGALLAGKICTTVLFVSLIALVLFPQLSQAWIDIIAFVDTVFLAIAFISYILAYFGKNRKFDDLNSQ